MSNSFRNIVLLFVCLLWAGIEVMSQISAPGSAFMEQTNYPVTSPNHPVFIFCSAPDEQLGSLLAQSALDGEKTYSWQKYNAGSGNFDPFLSEVTDSNQHQINNLADGGYRVVISSVSGQEVFTVWVFNNWFTLEAAIPESTCDYFDLSASMEGSPLTYYDPATKAPIEMARNMKYTWRSPDETIGVSPVTRVGNPPFTDTGYSVEAEDRFGCIAVASVTYHSIVTRAAFTADPMNGEAPLEVVFTNASENADAAGYEWHFFRDLDEIKEMGGTQPVDSIMLIAYDTSPVYIYENSGTYMVKLITRKTSEFYTCTDTAYLENYIVVDTSFVAAPNVFTPNGDGTNDNFVIKFWSMKEVKISIFNRWGRTVHVYENKNVQGFRNTWTVAAWDGKIGNKYASPGVYFWVVEGFGRDGVKRWKKGFVHLFRGKD